MCFFSKFEFRLLKFGLNSNFIYCGETLWGEMKVTACTPHAGKQSINSAISQDVKPCRALLPSTDVCSVSGPPKFFTLIACISIQHTPGAQHEE